MGTWVSSSGNNGMRRHWLICDCNTGGVLTASRLAIFHLVVFGPLFYVFLEYYAVMFLLAMPCRIIWPSMGIL